MTYQVKFVNDSTIIFEFTPTNMVLSLFLAGDFANFREDFLLSIDNVLNGKIEKEELTCDSTIVKIEKEKTLIEDLYLEGSENSCIVDTRELRVLMKEYLQKCSEFLKSKNGEAV